MAQWKWTIYDTNLLDTTLYKYLKGCGKMKVNILEAVEVFYLPYALKYINAPPLEIQKAFQRSIDLLQSRVKIMSLDAGIELRPDTYRFDSSVAAMDGKPFGLAQPGVAIREGSLPQATVQIDNNDDDDDDDDWDAPMTTSYMKVNLED